MSRFLRMATAQMQSQPGVGVFSVVHGKRGSLEKLGTRAANTKCSGECTCRCCK